VSTLVVAISSGRLNPSVLIAPLPASPPPLSSVPPTPPHPASPSVIAANTAALRIRAIWCLPRDQPASSPASAGVPLGQGLETRRCVDRRWAD
jgi:hypothetical protein